MALQLSPASQQQIADEAEARAVAAGKKAKKNLWWSFAGFAATAAVTAFFPPAVLPGVIALAGAAVGIMNGAYGIGYSANEHMLRKVKEESSQEGFVEKLQKRAAGLNRIFMRSNKLSDYGMYAAIGLAAVSWLVPVVAPVTWGLYTIGIFTMAGGTLVNAVTRDSSVSIGVISALATNLGEKDTLAAQIKPSNDNPPALSNTPSPSKEFDKAVNGPTADAPAPAPVKTPAPPKP